MVRSTSIKWFNAACTIGRVGLNELEAKEKGIEYEVTTYGLDDLDRAIADEEDHGLVKVLTVPGKDKILGATIVGLKPLPTNLTAYQFGCEADFLGRKVSAAKSLNSACWVCLPRCRPT